MSGWDESRAWDAMAACVDLSRSLEAYASSIAEPHYPGVKVKCDGVAITFRIWYFEKLEEPRADGATHQARIMVGGCTLEHGVPWTDAIRRLIDRMPDRRSAHRMFMEGNETMKMKMRLIDRVHPTLHELKSELLAVLDGIDDDDCDEEAKRHPCRF